MLNIAIIVLENSYCSSISGLIDVLQIANAHCRRISPQAKETFSWSLVTERPRDPVKVKGGIRLIADASLQSVDKFDLVYLPGVFYPGAKKFSQWLKGHQGLYKRLREWADKGIKIAANCTATFMLAESGLLNNKEATTTWWLMSQFQHRYPAVNLNINSALTKDGNIYCSGAMTAYHQLALHLVETHTSPEVAALCAKTMLINVGENTQTPYQNLNIPITDGDTLISRIQYWLKNHIQTDVNFSRLAQKFDISQRTLIRRFKNATGTTPLNYFQNLRMEHAKTLLAASPLSVADVVMQVGYIDPSAFNRLFKLRVGMSPSVYRQRFSEEGINFIQE